MSKKTFRINHIKQPWITLRLLELILDKDKALKKAKNSKKQEEWLEAKRLRNVCTNRLRKAKADFIKEQLDIHASDQNKFWKHIQQVIPNSSKGNKIITLNDLMNDNQIEIEDTADYTHEFFVNIGPNLAKNCLLDWNFAGSTCDHELKDIVTTQCTKSLSTILYNRL